MTIATSNLTRLPYGKGGRDVTLPVDGGTHIYAATLVSQLTATGMLVPCSTALSGPAIAVSTHEQDNSAGADGALRCVCETDRIFLLANAAAPHACSEATLYGAVVWAEDDHTISADSQSETLQPGGYFAGMEPDGKVRVFVSSRRIGADSEINEPDMSSVHGVRGASTANVANLAAFTVAAVDGLTYVAGERIFLKNQTATEENGIYVVGTVAGGTAPLTRSLDADGTDEVIAGMIVLVSEGTAGADTAWKLDTNDDIVVDTTGLTYTQIPWGFGLVGSVVASTIAGASAAGTGLTAARIDHKHALAAAVPTGSVVISAGVEGAATTAVRADHVHPCASAAPTGATLVQAAAEGVATTLARSDHAHVGASAAPTGATLVQAAAEGVATTYARSDHAHVGASAAPTGATLVQAAAEGAATTYARSDHAHVGASAAPTGATLVQAAAEGAATTYARSDHAHVGASAAPTGATLVQAAAEGAATTYARSDHAHVGASAAPGNTGSLNAEGAATTYARTDHTHAEHALEVRYVMTTNVANLAAFTVVQDGVTGIETDLVLLANQTGGDESGVYVIGAVAGGTAPLTRVAWLPATAVVRGGYTVHVEEGTLFADTNWFIAEAGAITIGTTAHHWYPESITQSVILVAGTVTVANVPVLSATKSAVVLTRQAANTCAATDGGYHATTGGATGITPGVVGTAAVIIEACVLAGTINNADISTLHATIINR